MQVPLVCFSTAYEVVVKNKAFFSLGGTTMSRPSYTIASVAPMSGDFAKAIPVTVVVTKPTTGCYVCAVGIEKIEERGENMRDTNSGVHRVCLLILTTVYFLVPLVHEHFDQDDDGCDYDTKNQHRPKCNASTRTIRVIN